MTRPAPATRAATVRKRGGEEILVIRLSSLGDIVLTFPALELLSRKEPQARIVVLTKRAYAPLVAAHPVVDEVLVLDETERGIRGAWRLARRIRERRFSRVIDLHGTPRSRFIAARSGARRTGRVHSRALARRRLVGAAFLRRVLHRPPPSSAGVGEVLPAVALAMARAVDPRVSEPAELPRPALELPAPALRHADELLAATPGAGPLIALCPGSRHATKGWPGYETLAKSLLDRGHRVAAVLGPEDEWQGASVPGCAIVRGPLLVLAAVLSRAQVAVGNDSGLTHVAAAAGAPVVAVFGPTVPELGFLPVGSHRVVERHDLNCRPCSVHGSRRCPRGDHACLAELDPALVMTAIDDIMQPAAQARNEVIHVR